MVMKIIIDTKEDKSELKRIAKLLLDLSNEAEIGSELKEGAMSMFDEKVEKKPFNINQLIEYE